MKYPDLYAPVLPELKGIGDEPNAVLERKAKATLVSRHRTYGKMQQDEHDRFIPMYMNGMSVNVKD